jgi:hypothetical protein
MTYVTGYWFVKNNAKRSYTSYLKIIENTFIMLKNCNIVFFYNESQVLDDIIPLVKTKNIIFIKRPIENMKTFDISNNYINACKQNGKNLLPYSKSQEKGKRHYNRECNKAGFDAYRKIFTIWTSKLFLLEEIMNLNPYKTANLCWIDSGISKFPIIDPADQKLDHGINIINGIFYGKRIHNKMNFIENNHMNMFGNKIPICACYFETSYEFIKTFNKIYLEFLEKYKDSNYCHDEETILAIIYSYHPNLFNKLN